MAAGHAPHSTRRAFVEAQRANLLRSPRSVRGGKAHPHAAWAAHQPARPVERRTAFELELGDSPQPFLDRDRELHARKVRADATMDAEPERGVPVLLAVEHDLVGTLEFFRI